VRAFLGVAIIAVTLGGAVAMHNYVRGTAPCAPYSHQVCKELKQLGKLRDPRPGWVDPVAIVLAVSGVGFGLILVVQAATRRRA
jgi:hypothetical protein